MGRREFHAQPDRVINAEIAIRAEHGLVMIAFQAEDGSERWEQWANITEAECVLTGLAASIAQAKEQLA